MSISNSKIRPSYLGQYYLSSILLIILLVFNIFVWQILKRQLYRAAEKVEIEKLQNTSTKTKEHFHEYTEVAIFGEALFETEDKISRKSFERYFEKIAQTHGVEEATALKAVAYIEKPSDVTKLAKEIENDTDLPLEDRIYFSIKPFVSEPSYVIKYIAPYSQNHNLIGYNIASDLNQSRVIEKAVNTKTISLTEKQTLLNEERFVIYKPIFTDKKMSELKGVLAIIIDPKVLFNNFEKTSENTAFSVYKDKITTSQINSKNLYFATKKNPLESLTKTKINKTIQYIPMIDRTFTFVFATPVNPELPVEQQLMLNIFLYGGSSIVFVLFIIINLLIITANKARLEKNAAANGDQK